MRTDKIHIVGGGIIGLCTAWYLKKEGCDVTLIDQGDFSDGTSYGNAGMIVPSHFIPMASPGVIAQGLKWMLNSKSPFYIKPRLDSALIQWLWHFNRSATAKHVVSSMPVLRELNERSKALYRAMEVENGFDFGYEERGLLMLYKTEKKAKEEKALAEKAWALGMQAEILDSDGLQKLEPEINLNVMGGVYFPDDAHLYPNLLMRQLIDRLRDLDVHIVSNTRINDLVVKGSKIISLLSEDGASIPVKNVLLSGGSWSGQLLKKAGIKLHLQDGKGYSFTLNKPKLRPSVPTILSEAKVAITPMGDDLRIGGTLELSGLSKTISQDRIKGICESIPEYYKDIDLPNMDSTKIWTGYRPCSPDGMPYIGRSESISNLHVGTGHGMMGLSLGAITGKLLSQSITEQVTSVSLHPFRLNRF